ncbi:magnesium and cobalt transport protein CorA [Thermococcus sp. P6]|uniref:magnesium/cobalt transporter CorA n=1 Tax=Thermococcus sp. P6 TaxID=122420 RepID=UPI000B59B3FC|nr:magnesium/cobalt transporter CorA [Thermococcus sp. P6]ASJ10433.1 magnesium and cobalt transport protein CorA [Thermococcus sp. P6]
MEKPGITVFAYSPGEFEERRIESLREALEFKEYRVVWVNVDGIAYIDELREIFGFHEASIKALLRSRSRARVSLREDYLFLLLYQIYEVKEGLKKERIGIFLRGNFVITLQERPGDVFNPVREAIRTGEGLFREKGAEYLVFALLDAIVENYLPILERISARMEELESRILKDGDREILRRVHGIRRRVLFIRRTIFSLLEVFRRLQLEGGGFFEGETRGYIEELHSHVMEVLDIIESQRDMANGLVEMYYSTLSLRINDIMRILTVVSTIFIPLTFITGLYGMNFRYMPELGWRYGYPAVLLTMLIIALGMLYYFRRKGWL